MTATPYGTATQARATTEPPTAGQPATGLPTTGHPTTGQRLAAIDTLLADPEAIPDPLEVELYLYRERLTGENVGC